MDRDSRIAAHIMRIGERTSSETDNLVSAALRRSWPGGSADSSEPWAREWVRRWGPKRTVIPVLVCSCAQGRCGVCN